MAAPLRRVLMRGRATPCAAPTADEWHYGPGFDARRAATSTTALAALVAASGASIEWIDDARRRAFRFGLHPRSFADDRSRRHHPFHGQSAPRASRRCTRTPIAAWACRSLAGSSRRARSRAATASGSTRKTLAIGRGVRTNQAGIQQMANLLGPLGVEVYGFDLPLWHGEEACLHLMSVISPLADDLALVYSPLLPAAFYQLLSRARHPPRRGRPRASSRPRTDLA